MSADNWTTCPKCQQEQAKELEQLQVRVDQSYGKVSAKEYLGMVTQLENPPKLNATLGETYEIGILKGKFYVRYGASCRKCGFTYEYKMDQPLEAL